MGLVFSLVQGGIFLGYIVFSVVRAMLPSSFKVPRVGHTALAATILGAAHLIGLPYVLEKLHTAHSYGQLKSLDFGKGCDEDHMSACEEAQVIYRASLVLFLYFVAMGALGGAVHYIYANLWPIKFLLVSGAFLGFLFIPDPSMFGMFAELARFLSLGYLLIQGFLILDFAHDLHEIIGAKADEHDSLSGSSGSIFSSWWRILYLFLSASFLTATGFGFASIFTNFAGCALGATLGAMTLGVGVIATVLSLLESVGIGLLPPAMLFAHSTFLCWYALSSNPDESCNAYAGHDLSASPGKTIGVLISVMLLLVTVGWCTWQGEKVMGVFGMDEDEANSSLIRSGINSDREVRRSRKERGKRHAEQRETKRILGLMMLSAVELVPKVDDDEETECQPSRVLYCVIMAFASAYAAMAITAWATSSGSPEAVEAAGPPLRSLWFKIIAQWVAVALQVRVIWVTYRDNQESSGYRTF